MLSSVESAGLKLAKLKMVRFSPDDASVLFGARARCVAVWIPLPLVLLCVMLSMVTVCVLQCHRWRAERGD